MSVSAIAFIGAVTDTSGFPSTTDTNRGFPDDGEVAALVLTFLVLFVLLVGFTSFVIASVTVIARVTRIGTTFSGIVGVDIVELCGRGGFDDRGGVDQISKE